MLCKWLNLVKSYGKLPIRLDKFNYDVEELSENKNLNKYTDIYEKSKDYINKINRIDNVNQFLINNINQKCFKEIFFCNIIFSLNHL